MKHAKHTKLYYRGWRKNHIITDVIYDYSRYLPSVSVRFSANNLLGMWRSMRAHVRVYENVSFERDAFSPSSCLYVSEQTLADPPPDSRKGMEDARRPSEAPFPSSITPSAAHPLNVANEAAVTRSGDERGMRNLAGATTSGS